jgi:type IV secretory pathway TraG/TraD family ATPase VirD4
VIGPTRCGKTANTISGILEWKGPAVLSSVKTDLLEATMRRRAAPSWAR